MWLWGPILSRLVHETSQSRGGKEHLSKLQMQNWFSEEHVYWGWEFRAFMGLSEPHTTWEPPVAVLELSVPPGRDGGGASRVSISNQSPRDTCTVEAKALDHDSELGRAFIVSVWCWTG